MVEDFSSQTRRLSAGILTDDKGKQRGMAGKGRPSGTKSSRLLHFSLFSVPAYHFMLRGLPGFSPGSPLFDKQRHNKKAKNERHFREKKKFLSCCGTFVFMVS